jgi:translocation and assembly module TamB
VDASASVRDYDISLGVHGTLEKLNTVYRSEPPLPQADIIALLALGRTQEQAQIYQQQESSVGADATTNALLGGALNATVSNRVQKFFGVGQVKIDPNFVGTLGQSTARVTVTQQLSKAVTLTYATNVNETSQQLIQAQFALTRDVSLVAVRDEAGVFSLLVKVRQRKR